MVKASSKRVANAEKASRKAVKISPRGPSLHVRNVTEDDAPDLRDEKTGRYEKSGSGKLRDFVVVLRPSDSS